jgi:hypothetical protein
VAPRPRQDRLNSSGASNAMDDPNRSGAVRDRRLMLAAIVLVGLVIAALAYQYSDALIELAQSLAGGKLGHAQSRSLHY